MTSNEKLKQLIELYDYQEYVNPEITYKIIKSLKKKIKAIDYEEIARLILLLKLCKGSEIKVSSTINSTTAGYVKGKNMTITIKSEVFQSLIENMLNTYLLREREGLYINKFGLTPKEFQTFQDGSKSNFKELLSEQELNSILNEESVKIIIPQNASEGIFINSLLNLLFGDNTAHKRVKEYSFVYDILVLSNKANFIGEGYIGTIGKEKYDYIKNRIQAWESYKRKYDIQ